MRILPRLTYGPNPMEKPAAVDPKVLETGSWAAHLFCYGLFVGLGTSNGHGFVGPDIQHLNLEPSEGIGSEFHGIGLEVVREGKALTRKFLDLR